jgi:hypothetical protein
MMVNTVPEERTASAMFKCCNMMIKKGVIFLFNCPIFKCLSQLLLKSCQINPCGRIPNLSLFSLYPREWVRDQLPEYYIIETMSLYPFRPQNRLLWLTLLTRSVANLVRQSQRQEIVDKPTTLLKVPVGF